MIWLCHVLFGFIALGWSYAFLRTVRAFRKRKWELSPKDKKSTSHDLVSIIIPARNEEYGIHRAVVTALEQDHEHCELLVFNDGSTDKTGEILQNLKEHHPRAGRLTLLTGEGGQLPQGWYGKPWALQRAQQHASGSWLAFVDADVNLNPALISRALAYAQDHGLEMVTGLGRLEVDSFWEKVLQPAVGALILAGNSLSQVNDSSLPEKNLANGQFIMISRKAYDQLGQHECVQSNILDDIGIARALSAKRISYHCLILNDLFSCRMYTSFAEIWEGWSKNLFAGLRYSWMNLITAVSFTFLFSCLGPLLLLLSVFIVIPKEMLIWGFVITLLLQATRAVADLRRDQPILYGITHAPASFIVCLLMVNSGIRSARGTVSWKGRRYRPSANTAKEDV